MSGVFITLEGGEGAGKSTQLAGIRDFLLRAGKPVELTREPGGTPFAEAVRELLLAPRDEPVTPDAELLLMFAARAAHLQDRIIPAIGAGKWVVCDRFTDATYAYQGGGRGISPARIAVLEQFVQDTFRPHATILLDAPVDIGLERAKGRSGKPDRFEREDIAFFTRVRNAYLERARAEPERFHIVDAAQPLGAVNRGVEAVLEKLLEKHG